MNLTDIFLTHISTGLRRSSITLPSVWAEQYRVMKDGKWSFKFYPWLREMHDAKSELCVGMKGAQVGYTEVALNVAFFNIDLHRRDVLYVLPNKTPDASDFSASRFDPALESSSHLANMFSDVKNVGHKRAGVANLYIRGSQSRAGLKSVPVAILIMDEVEEFNQDNISLAKERVSGQLNHQIWMISTPTIEDTGIHAAFKSSTQEHFFFKCPSCSRSEQLTWPDSLVITAEDRNDINIKNSHYVCKQCKNTLPHENKHEWLKTGNWVKQVEHITRGFHINQMYSPTITPAEFALKYLNGQSDQAEEQEFFNSKCGLPHAVEGAQLDEATINKCIHTYKAISIGNCLTLGVDIGTYLHYEVIRWIIPSSFRTRDINVECKAEVHTIGKTTDIGVIDDLMGKYNIRFAVLDANPERRMVVDFCNRHYGRARYCFYGRGLSNKQMNTGEQSVTVDRTSWLDLSLNRFRQQTIRIPYTVPLEYKDHLRALVRRYQKDKDGNPIGRYISGGKPDHYAHARNYSEIALPFALSMSKNYNIKSP